MKGALIKAILGVSVKMLASNIYTFTVVFIAFSLIIVVLKTLTEALTGIPSISAFLIIIYGIVAGAISVGIRLLIMKRFAKIRI